MTILLRAAICASAILLPSLAYADDWLAIKLRGTVLELVDGQWQPLKRGDVVPDGNAIRTMADGHADFVRGYETVSLSPGTQIIIFDKARTGAKPYTTVQQAYGTIGVEAEVQQVQHFAVVTPYLAAVVKGTRFSVASGKGGSAVAVARGHVEVDNSHTRSHVLISRGQSAKITSKHETAVAGLGKLPPVLSRTGMPVGPRAASLGATAKTLAEAAKEAKDEAKLLGTPEAKAAAKAAEDAARAAAKLEKEAAKANDKDTKAVADAAKKAADAAKKAAEDAAKKKKD